MKVRHDTRGMCFLAVENSVPIGELNYTMDDNDTLQIIRTSVPPEFGGRGIAAELVKAAAEYALAQGMRVVPACSYAARFFEKNAELYGGLVRR